LVEHEDEVYPYLAQLGERTRQTIESAFGQEGILAHCTGHGNDALPGSSMFMIHFPYRQDAHLDRPEHWFDPEVCDITLTHHVLDLVFLAHDVFMLHSHGAVSTSHTEADIDILGQACQKVARHLKPYL
jgi:glutamate-1-semialdehyde aminotransferase